MPKTVGAKRFLVLKDKQVQSSGSWVIYSSLTEIGFSACHEIPNDKQEPKIIEEILLKTVVDVRKFYLNLIQHGWTDHPRREK
jgi:hypothetical protein